MKQNNKNRIKGEGKRRKATKRQSNNERLPEKLVTRQRDREEAERRSKRHRNKQRKQKKGKILGEREPQGGGEKRNK